MTEIYNINASSVLNTCRVCLRANVTVLSISREETIWYQTFVNEDPSTNVEMLLCTICRHLLHKFRRFVQQCKSANDNITQLLLQGPKSHISTSQLTYSHDFSTQATQILYIGPEDTIDLGLNDLKTENKTDIPESNEYESIAEYNDAITDDDEEIPLVMLKNGEIKSDVDADVMNRERKRKKRRSLNDLEKQSNINSAKIKNETGIKREDCVTQDSCNTVGNRKKSKKAAKEGFSSRMVQETEEYLVIKLTKDQVEQEMVEKSTSEKYKRALYKCQQCVKGFNFEDVLRSHMEKHTKKNGKLQCDICMQYCPSAVSLRGHIKSHTTRYKCKVCGDVRLSRQHLLEHHAISHTSEATEYTCEHCYFTTNKRTVIQRHVKTHKASKRHACHECGRLFQSIESLRVHITRHDKTKSLQCEYCTRKFIYPSLLQKHVKSVHVQKDYYCVECDVRFKSPDNLRLHFKKAKKHRDSSAYTHECQHCEEKFVSAPSLSVHLTTAHDQPKEHACELCRRLYSSRESLKGHIRRVHTERKPAAQTCHICKKIFSRKSILTIHMRTHTGERPYACGLCGTAFSQHTSLRAHTAAKHHS